jgi:hypothetical protein
MDGFLVDLKEHIRRYREGGRGGARRRYCMFLVRALVKYPEHDLKTRAVLEMAHVVIPR